MSLVEGAPSSFAGAIPAAEVRGDLEYLIEAFDEEGNGPARAGEEGRPLRIRVEGAAATTTSTTTAPATDTPPTTTTTSTDPTAAPGTGSVAAPEPSRPDEGGAGLWIGLAAGGAAVLALGLLAGVGAFYALRPSTPTQIDVAVAAPSPFAGALP
jgi:hypothetical protein